MKLKSVSLIVVLLWLFIQVVMIFVYWETPQYSDAHIYQLMAIDCYEHNEWYPMRSQLYDNFLFNPGYVNFLILELKLFGSFSYHSIIGLLLNILLLLIIRKIVGTLLIEKAKEWVTILYCIMYSNMIIIIPTMSDLLYSVLLFGGLCFLRKNYLFIVFSAFTMTCAEYVRPLLPIFILSILLFLIIKYSWKYLCCYIISLVLFTSIINWGISHITAAHNAKGSTLGYNLIMGANDDMNGTVNFKVFEKGNLGFIENIREVDVYNKDLIWRERAINWILDNPVKYLSYIPIKLGRLWWGDHYMDLPLKNLESSDLNKLSNKVIFLRAVKIIVLSLGYYVVIGFALYGIWRKRKQILGYWGIFILPLILASGMHCVLYGGMRYHYPYVPILLLYACVGIMSMKKQKLL